MKRSLTKLSGLTISGLLLIALLMFAMSCNKPSSPGETLLGTYYGTNTASGGSVPDTLQFIPGANSSDVAIVTRSAGGVADTIIGVAIGDSLFIRKQIVIKKPAEIDVLWGVGVLSGTTLTATYLELAKPDTTAVVFTGTRK